MGEPLPDWSRRYFREGGGDPFLFYVVYGNIDQSRPLERQKYRVQSVPDRLEMMSYGPEDNPGVAASFREGYLWDELSKTNPELAANVLKEESCLVARGDFADSPNLNYLRDTIGLLTYFLDSGGVAIYDPQMFRWWSPTDWRSKIFDPAAAVPRHHTIILVSDEGDGTQWIHTRGMRKFGRPDISVHNVTAAMKAGVVDLCNRFIEMQAFGGVVPEGQEVRTKELPSGLHCFHRGALDDPDFNNVHVSIE